MRGFMARPRQSPKQSRRAARKEEERGPQRLADWQRSSLWMVWLAVLALLIAGTDKESLSLAEFGAIVAGIAITVWNCRNPRGGPKKLIEESSEVRGEFVSRANWALVLVGAGLTLGGLAGGMKIIHDVSHGLTTIGGVFEDMALFVLEWIKERLSGGTEGDVTHTKMYTLILLLPIGLLMLLFLSPPLFFRGMRFRVEDDGTIQFRDCGVWKPLGLEDYSEAAAGAFTIEFKRAGEATAAVVLPQARVFSAERGTRVEGKVLAAFFRERLEASGFAVESKDSKETPSHWRAQRGEQLS
jgi:hypothetical protein